LVQPFWFSDEGLSKTDNTKRTWPQD
jgi:hypothetical protein